MIDKAHINRSSLGSSIIFKSVTGSWDKNFNNYYSKFLYSHVFCMSLGLPWQSIAWSCSGNLQEVAINIIRPHTNPLGILEIKEVAITTLENTKSPPTLYIKHKQR